MDVVAQREKRQATERWIKERTQRIIGNPDLYQPFPAPPPEVILGGDSLFEIPCSFSSTTRHALQSASPFQVARLVLPDDYDVGDCGRLYKLNVIP